MSLFSPKPAFSKTSQHNGMVAWRSPSNIALVKYWGKRPVQLPANASISFTLSEAYTETSISYTARNHKLPWIDFSFEGQREKSFEDRITRYFTLLTEYLPWLEQLSFQIKSHNSFPHSSGIASSASSMSALALCLCDIEQAIYEKATDKGGFLHKASFLSRLGSGSACRSLYPGLAAWGKTSHIQGSSDGYAIAVSSINDVFSSFHDDVLIVSPEQKSVSSSAGHALMNTNIFAKQRYIQADQHLKNLLVSMKAGDIMSFGKIVEDEALTLHALMMCSDPSYILMKPETLAVIDLIRTFRKEEGLPVFFTLDAGPNVHILYPDTIVKEAREFINKKLLPLAVDNRVINDKVGEGPFKLI